MAASIVLLILLNIPKGFGEPVVFSSVIIQTPIADSLYTAKQKERAYIHTIDSMLNALKEHPELRDMDNMLKVEYVMEKLEDISGRGEGSPYAKFNSIKKDLFSLKNIPAPNFTLKDIKGKKISLKSLKGKVVLLDFWSVYCGPCIAAIPHSNQMQDELKGKPFEVVTICFDSPEDQWKKLVNDKQWKGIHLLDAEDQHVQHKYIFNAYPYYVLIDKKGIIRDKGNLSLEQVRLEIEGLLKE